MIKPDCYKCIYRGNVPGDCHSRCKFPGTKTGMFDMFDSNNMDLANTLEIKTSEYSIKMGWFMWPVNFDPVWLENCNGFKEKE